jgi:hypothetical protein
LALSNDHIDLSIFSTTFRVSFSCYKDPFYPNIIQVFFLIFVQLFV